jgi:hypothetical protein
MDEDTLQEPAETPIGRGPVQIESPPPGMQIPSFYTNSVQLQLSVFDLKLLFGVIVSAAAPQPLMRPIAEVVMSPQHAKALAALLTAHVRGYENRFGQLPEIPGLNEAEMAASELQPPS